MRHLDTIFALSSGRLPAGIAVIRISGPKVRFVYETMIGALAEPRVARLVTVLDENRRPLDRGMAIWFANRQSFTGEDVLELQLHGGKAVVAAVLRSLSEFNGLRHAEPGEFTRRAFANGKLDLTQAEALADLISAETESQRRFALLNADGGQRELYAGWRSRLVHGRAMIEAELDFADEGDVPEATANSVWLDMQALADELSAHVEGFGRAEMIRDGFDVVIVGAPNAGKSSLLNALVQREAAIVSSEAGTTRDLIEVVLDLGGHKIRITDTAGLRDAEGEVERIGIGRAMERASRAHLVIELVDLSRPVRVEEAAIQTRRLRVGSKSDLSTTSDNAGLDVVTSSVNGSGVSQLLSLILAEAELALGSEADLMPSRLRHVSLLRDAEQAIRRALGQGLPLELRAEELRMASASLGKLTGEVDVEDLLDAIFSTFCIGK